jgi:hypothetical protein
MSDYYFAYTTGAGIGPQPTVASGANVPFGTSGASSANITHPDAFTFTFTNAGTYHISWQISVANVSAPSYCSFGVNINGSFVIGSGTINHGPSAMTGYAVRNTTQVVGSIILTATAGNNLTIPNLSGVTVTLDADGFNSFNPSISIVRIK